MTEIVEQKNVLGCKYPFLNFLHGSHALRCVGYLVELTQPKATNKLPAIFILNVNNESKLSR